MSNHSPKSKSMPWFKCWFAEWETDEMKALDLPTIGFMHILRMRMIERRAPFPEAFLSHIARERGVNRRTIERMLDTLTGYSLIARENGFLWCESVATEIEARGGLSEKFGESFEKVSQNQRKIAQQKQQRQSTREEVDIDGRPLKGGVRDTDRDNRTDSGLPSANAGQPSSTDDEYSFAEPDLDSQPAHFDDIPPPEADPIAGYILASYAETTDHEKADARQDAEKRPTSDDPIAALTFCERFANRMSDGDAALLEQMRLDFKQAGKLSSGQVRMLRDEILPVATRFHVSDGDEIDDVDFAREPTPNRKGATR